MTKEDARLSRIIKDDSAEDMVTLAQEVGERLATEDLGKTAIRNIFGMVRQIEAVVDEDRLKREITLLRPKLAYAAARQPKLKGLTDQLDQAIRLVCSEQDTRRAFRNFVQFFEAMVAYHYAAHEMARQGGRR